LALKPDGILKAQQEVMGNGKFGGRGGRGGRQNGNGERRHGGRNGGGGNGGGRGGRRRHSRGRSNNPRQSAESGNQRERIAVESGALVLIDQFMLANPQFIEKLIAIMDEGSEAKDTLINTYGGSVVQVKPGTYRIERDPFEYSIVVHPEGGTPDIKSFTRTSCESRGRVFVDTRCVAMIDRELLDDTALLEKYQQLWFSGQDKACRDLIRDNGGAVRYGFNRYGDELGIYLVPNEDIVCLWPDIIEGALAGEGGMTGEVAPEAVAQ